MNTVTIGGVVPPVNGPGSTRTYRSPRREEQAAATRRRILRAAKQLFTTRGYPDTNVAEVARRAAVIGREPAELRQNGVAGTPAEVVVTIGRYAEAGSERIYLQVLDLADLDQLELVAAEVMPQL